MAEIDLTLPPCPAGLPVLGNILQLGALPHRSLGDMARRHGPVMLLRLGATRAVVVSSAEAAHDVTKGHDKACCNRPVWQCASRVSYDIKNVAFAPYTPTCRAMRKLLSVGLHGVRGLEATWAARHEQVGTLMSALADAATAATSVELDHHVLRAIDGIVGTVTYGGVHGAEEDRFKLLHDTIDIVGCFGFEDFFPHSAARLFDRLFGVVARRERVFASLDTFFEAILEKHLDPARPEPESGGGDFVDELLRVREEKGWTREHVKALLLDAFVGGVDTSHITIMWAMLELVRTPRAMQRVQEELRSVVAAGKVRREDLQHLTYLNMVVKEVLRLHPPATLLLPRETQERVKIGGYDVPEGTRLFVNVWAIGRDPAVWGADADVFEPERFKAGGRHADVDFRGGQCELLPFGAGRRICPGLSLAVTNVQFVLASILHGFDWRLPSGVEPEDLNMEEAGTILFRRKTPLVVVPCHPARNELGVL